MNREFLGDAHDWLKGALFHHLKSQVLKDFAIDPMITDATAWSKGEYELYARLLRVKPAKILRRTGTVQTNRDRYFEELKHRGDLFLDPDTGIRTGKSSPVRKYIKPNELVELLDFAPERMVAVYQHIRAQKASDRLAALRTTLCGLRRNLRAAIYSSASVAVLFTGYEPRRVHEVYKELRTFLGSCAERRVMLW